MAEFWLPPLKSSSIRYKVPGGLVTYIIDAGGGGQSWVGFGGGGGHGNGSGGDGGGGHGNSGGGDGGGGEL